MDYNLLKDAVTTLFAGQNPYVRLTNFHGPHNYPPTAFLFLIFLQNRLLFDILSFLAFYISIYLLTNKKIIISSILVFSFYILYFPLKFNCGMGQVNNFILLFIVLAYYYNPFFLAYAIGIKLTPVIFLFYFFIRNEYKKIFSTIFFVFVLICISVFVVNLNFQRVYFFDVFWRAFGSGGKEVYYNQSLAGLLSRSNLPFFYFPFSFLILFVTWFRGRYLSKERVLSAVTCLMLMLNPIAWQHHFVLALIPLILLFNHHKLLVIISFLLLAWNFRHPENIPVNLNFILSHQFYGIFILWVTALFDRHSSKILFVAYSCGIIFVYIRYLLCRGFICF